jgi:hypothetical protein
VELLKKQQQTATTNMQQKELEKINKQNRLVTDQKINSSIEQVKKELESVTLNFNDKTNKIDQELYTLKDFVENNKNGGAIEAGEAQVIKDLVARISHISFDSVFFLLLLILLVYLLFIYLLFFKILFFVILY